MISVFLGVMSASFGGVIRDTLSNEIPLIFHKEIYATACIIGAVLFLLLNQLGVNPNLNYLLTTSMVIAVRLVAVRFKLQLPTFYRDQ